MLDSQDVLGRVGMCVDARVAYWDYGPLGGAFTLQNETKLFCAESEELVKNCYAEAHDDTSTILQNKETT